MEQTILENQTPQTPQNTRNLPMTYGLIVSIILIVVSLGFHFTSFAYDSWTQYISILIHIVGIILMCAAYGKQQQGQVTFGNVFGKAFRMIALITVIMIVWGLLSNYIFPEIREHAMELARMEMEKNNMEEDTMDKALSITEKFYSILLVAGTVFSFVFWGLLGALIGALITKKNKNPQPF